MPLQSVRDEILNTLKDLGNDDFKEFCSKLTDPDDEPRIRAADVEHKSSRREIRNLLVSRCTEAGALGRTVTVLRDIGCNNEAMHLESRTQTTPSKGISSIVSESRPSPEPLDNQASNVPKQLQKAKQVEPQADKAEVVPKASPAPADPRVTMLPKDIIRGNKTSLLSTLSEDHKLILQKVHEHKLITDREYRNLKSINNENVEGHIIQLLDKLMGKGDETCQRFLDLLETDSEIKGTFPDLKSLHLSHTSPITAPVQETCVMDNRDDGGPRCKKTKLDEPYPVNSIPRGICLILNNINFENEDLNRPGSEKDAESLGEVFSRLGFRVLMCEDQTEAEMSHILTCFSTLSNISELQKLRLKEWSKGFGDLQEPLPKHGDVFICCILSHGKKEVVCGTDMKTIPIKDVTRTFKASNNSPLTGKPKIFLIQACQGGSTHRGVVEKGLETDEGSVVSVPEEADFLIAVATVENYVSFRSRVKGSWFIQSLCQQLKEGCERGDDIHSILQCVNSDVSEKEGSNLPGQIKQMPEIRYTLRKKLLLSPLHTEA